MRTLAVIPCKSMSQRVPGKNFRVLGDKRLYKWTVEAAKKGLGSGIGKIIISTDKPDRIAPEDQVMVEERPKHLPKHLLDCDAWKVLKYHAEKHPGFDAYMMLQPTSPFRDENDIKEALIVFSRSGGMLGTLLSVTPDWDPNGAIYIWKKAESIVGLPYQAPFFQMTKIHSLEIDTEEDFEIAEAVAKHIVLPRIHTLRK